MGHFNVCRQLIHFSIELVNNHVWPLKRVTSYHLYLSLLFLSTCGQVYTLDAIKQIFIFAVFVYIREKIPKMLSHLTFTDSPEISAFKSWC